MTRMKMKTRQHLALLILPLLLVLAFVAGKATLAEADFSVGSWRQTQKPIHRVGIVEAGNPLAFGATSAVTGSLSISGTVISNITQTSAGVTWQTNEPSDATVRYGTSSEDLSLSVTNPVTSANHSVNLVNLTPDTQYFLQVESTDLEGDPAVDDNGGGLYQFTTAAAELKHRAFPGTVEGDPGQSVTLVQQGTREKVMIILPADYPIKTPGGSRAGDFEDGARVVILAEAAGDDWVALWVLVKPVPPVPPVAGIVTGVGPTSMTVTDAKGVAHLLRGNSFGKDLNVGDVVTVLRGKPDEAKSIVTADQVRDRVKRSLEEISEPDDEEEDEEERESKSRRAKALVKALERLEDRQIDALSDALLQVSDRVREKILEARLKAEEEIESARTASDKARGKYAEIEPREDDEEEEENDRRGRSDDRRRDGGSGRGNSSDSDDDRELSDRGNGFGNSGKGHSEGKGNSDESDDDDDEDDEDEDKVRD